MFYASNRQYYSVDIPVYIVQRWAAKTLIRARYLRAIRGLTGKGRFFLRLKEVANLILHGETEECAAGENFAIHAFLVNLTSSPRNLFVLIKRKP